MNTKTRRICTFANPPMTMEELIREVASTLREEISSPQDLGEVRIHRNYSHEENPDRNLVLVEITPDQ